VLKVFAAANPCYVAVLQALRCLKLYLERLGFTFQPDGSSSSSNQAAISDTIDLVSRAAMDAEFLNYRPTITAAAALYCERLQKGLLPFWPSSLAGLTGYSNAQTPELAAAINGAQRLIKTLALSKREGDVAPAAVLPAAAASEAVAASPSTAAAAAGAVDTDSGEACVPIAVPVAVPAAAADAAVGPA
jgi:pentatricopeptide repeat domain-containing protein 1